MERNRPAPKVAFALGGLGGSNAHGAGFLHAASRLSRTPDIISCTSGMIHWVWLWLTKRDLRAEMEKMAAATPFKEPFLPVNWWLMSMFGVHGVMRPAYAEYWQNLFRQPPPMTPGELLERIQPAQRAVPTRTEGLHRRIAKTFNDHEKPILFNCYDPRTGVEYLHANPAAMAMRDRLEARRSRTLGARTEGEEKRLALSLPKVVWAPVTPEAVRDALWLTAYGFERPPHEETRRIDGAYVRQFILNELSEADVVFAARPQSFRYAGELPKDIFEVQDLQTELWFNGSYAQQVARMDGMNRLIRSGRLNGPPFHEITLVPVEIGVPRGFFNYFIEDMTVFERSVIESTRSLEEYWPAQESPNRTASPSAWEGVLSRVHLRTQGSADLPALWLVHGFGETSQCFQELCATDLARGYRLFTFDLPGFGSSPDAGLRSVEEFGALLAALIDKHCPGETVGIVAHSLGAPIAVRAAKRLGRRVAGLFSIEGNLFSDDTFLTGAVAGHADPQVAHDQYKSMIDDLIRKGGSNEAALRRYRTVLDTAAPAVLHALARSIVGLGNAPFDEYHSLETPTFFYCGDGTHPKTRDRIAERGVPHRRYDGDGHWPMIDRPGPTATEIRDFFGTRVGFRLFRCDAGPV